ncbi:MAG: cell division protein SepF [Candidatus Korarchaeota archaeon]|nr:cell division protein SepF [Candidatus Korarchaeota archaeon]
MKALLLRNLEDVETIKREVKSGNILILRISALAKKSVEDVKRVVDELCRFTELIGGDIARLGEERVVITPSSVRIWREKTTIQEQETPTAA